MLIKQHWTTICLFVVMLVSFVLMVFSAKSDSIVVDEKIHITAGYLHTWEGNYTFNAEHPPLLNDLAGLFAKIAKPNVPDYHSFLGTEQWEYADLFLYHSGNDVEKITFWARFPFILLTLGIIFLVYLWAKTLFGKTAGLIAATLAAFSPNILAHGRLATTDIGLAFFFLLTIWWLRKYILKPNWLNALILGIGVGLVLLSKFSGLIVLPIVLVGFILVLFEKKQKWLKTLTQLIFVLLITGATVWAVYLFSMRSDIAQFQGTYEMSKTFSHKVLTTDLGKTIFIPFDKFAQGMEILSDHNVAGHWSYLNGKVDYQGWWYYFPLVLWYKLTLPVLLLLVLAIVSFKKIHKSFLEEFLVIFPALLFLVFSLFSRIDIGIRHIIVILPLLFIFISRLALVKNLYLKPIVYILVICHIVVGLVAYPNYIAYFNQIAGGAKGGINHLADSNLDWNQNMKRFDEFAESEGIDKVYSLCWDIDSFEYYGVKSEILSNNPVNGVVAICAQQLMVPPEGFDFSWVIKNEPDAVVGNAMYIWRFDKKPIELR